MAKTIVDTYKNAEGDTINIYESGAHYNASQGHLVKAPPQHAITPERSRQLKEKQAEKKRQALLEGAFSALDKKRIDKLGLPMDLSVVYALGAAIMIKAMDPANPKQVDAARFVLQEAGLAETQTKSSAEAQQFGELGAAIVQLIELMTGAQAQARESVDGRIVDVDAAGGSNE